MRYSLNISTTTSLRATCLAAAGAALLAALGCQLFHRTASAEPTTKAAVKKETPMLAVDLTKVKPNEAGLIPILMYHDLITHGKPTEMKYPASQFRADMEWLYNHNYRPVSFTQFVQGKVDCPAGKYPVILTFDDALRGQFNYRADGTMAPDCAVGILDTMHKEHSDWQTRGTFFVLTNEDPRLPPPFYQEQYARGKLEYLVKHGYDIGNHSVHHRNMRNMNQAQVNYEIVKAIDGIHNFLPNYDVNTFAIPYGKWPKTESWMISGTSGGSSYHNIAVVRAAWRPSPASTNKGFKPYEIERITPGKGVMQSYWWFNYLDHHASERYISDGDPNTVTVKQMAIGQVDKSRITKAGLHLRTYRSMQRMDSNKFFDSSSHNSAHVWFPPLRLQ